MYFSCITILISTSYCLLYGLSIRLKTQQSWEIVRVVDCRRIVHTRVHSVLVRNELGIGVLEYSDMNEIKYWTTTYPDIQTLLTRRYYRKTDGTKEFHEKPVSDISGAPRGISKIIPELKCCCYYSNRSMDFSCSATISISDIQRSGYGCTMRETESNAPLLCDSNTSSGPGLGRNQPKTLCSTKSDVTWAFLLKVVRVSGLYNHWDMISLQARSWENARSPVLFRYF